MRTIVTRTAVEGHRALGRSGTQPQRNGSRLCDENALVGSLPSTFIWGYLWGYLVRPEDLTLLSHSRPFRLAYEGRETSAVSYDSAYKN